MASVVAGYSHRQQRSGGGGGSRQGSNVNYMVQNGYRHPRPPSVNQIPGRAAQSSKPDRPLSGSATQGRPRSISAHEVRSGGSNSHNRPSSSSATRGHRRNGQGNSKQQVMASSNGRPGSGQWAVKHNAHPYSGSGSSSSSNDRQAQARRLEAATRRHQHSYNSMRSGNSQQPAVQNYTSYSQDRQQALMRTAGGSGASAARASQAMRDQQNRPKPKGGFFSQRPPSAGATAQGSGKGSGSSSSSSDREKMIKAHQQQKRDAMHRVKIPGESSHGSGTRSSHGSGAHSSQGQRNSQGHGYHGHSSGHHSNRNHSSGHHSSSGRSSSGSSSSGSSSSGSSSSGSSSSGSSSSGGGHLHRDEAPPPAPEAEQRRLLKLIASGQLPRGKSTTEFYHFGRVLGVGSFGKVRVAWHKLTGMRVAVKTYEKAKTKDPSQWKRVQQEVHLMERLNHCHCVRLFEALETPKRVHIIMEHAGGGSLCSYVKMRKRLAEEEARHVFSQVSRGVEYLHAQHIIHRDIKLENILLDSVQGRNMKLVDFGFSVFVRDKKLRIFCGTPSYMAPEIVQRREYAGRPVDVWSLGVLLYACLCGCFPFTARSYPELYKKIVRGQFRLPDFLSHSARDLLRSLLVIDPHRRFTLQQARNHPWAKAVSQGSGHGINGLTPPDTSHLVSADPSRDLDEVVLAKMESFGLQREAVTALVLERAHNCTTTCYYLMLSKLTRQRQRARQQQLQQQQHGASAVQAQQQAAYQQSVSQPYKAPVRAGWTPPAGHFPLKGGEGMQQKAKEHAPQSKQQQQQQKQPEMAFTRTNKANIVASERDSSARGQPPSYSAVASDSNGMNDSTDSSNGSPTPTPIGGSTPKTIVSSSNGSGGGALSRSAPTAFAPGISDLGSGAGGPGKGAAHARVGGKSTMNVNASAAIRSTASSVPSSSGASTAWGAPSDSKEQMRREKERERAGVSEKQAEKLQQRLKRKIDTDMDFNLTHADGLYDLLDRQGSGPE